MVHLLSNSRLINTRYSKALTFSNDIKVLTINMKYEQRSQGNDQGVFLLTFLSNNTI
jgi:hypothetical protein